jgi:thiamine transporter ThiT
MGVLSVLPFISAGNLCCCLWVISGGVVAAYLLQQNQEMPVTPADGALVGLLAGVLGAFVYLILSIPLTFLLAPMQRQAIEQLIDSGTLPPEFRDYLAAYVGGVLGIVIQFLVTLVAGVVFSTLGGFAGAVIFRKPPSPPGPIDLPAGAPGAI